MIPGMTETRKTFHDFEAVLCASGALMDAAEVHGLVCAMLCRGAADEARSFLLKLVGGEETAEHTPFQKNCLAVFFDIQASLQGIGMGFTLFLPDDEHHLDERMKGLTHWCQGFVQGMGAGVIAETQKNTSAEFGELLTHIQEISDVEMKASEDDHEAEEAAFESLVNYFSLGVLNLHQVLNEEIREAEGESETIH